MNRVLALAFAGLVLAAGIVFAALTPIGQVADEVQHIVKADSLTYGKFLGRRIPSAQYGTEVMEGNTFADPGLFLTAYDSLFAGRLPQTKAWMAETRQFGWEHTHRLFQIGPVAGYMPVFYMPSAVGLGLGRLLGASPYNSAQAGRLINVLVFVAMGTAAVLLARRGRALLMCVLSVPMTLSLAASFNQDGLLIGAAVLAAALASRAWDHAAVPEDILRERWFWAAAVLIAVIGAVKPPYLALGVMLLLPLPTNWASRADRDALWQRAGILALVCLPGLLWLTLAIPEATGNLSRAAYQAGPLWPGPRPAEFHGTDLQAQLHVLLAHPLQIFALPAGSFFGNSNLLPESIGVLGLLNVVLPTWFYRFWHVVILLAVVGDMLVRRTAPGLRPNVTARGIVWRSWGLEAALLLLAAIAAIWAVYVSQYLAWTSVGMARIDGVSGRYLLPVVPLVALALPRLALPGGQSIGLVLRWVPVVALAVGLYAVPRTLLTSFYLQ